MPELKISPHLRISYFEHNPSGSRPVLLLHGLGVNGSSWQLQVPALLECDFRVIAPDMRGFGKSTYPGGPVTIQVLSKDMVTLIDFLDISQVDLVGISMGGTIALQLALDHPELVRKLILVNTFAHLRPDKLRGWIYFAVRFGLVQLLGFNAQAKVVANHLFPRPDQEELRQIMISQIMQANPKCYRATMWALWNFDVLSRLDKIVPSTLVVTGDSDTTVPVKTQKQLAAKIKHARQAFIPDAGHALIVEKPDEFNRIMIQFLE
jgi:3-oxoadipate enol-lactonase